MHPKPFKFCMEALLERRALSESQERATGAHVDVLLSRAPQSLCILTHRFDGTDLQSKKGNFKGIMRKRFADVGSRASHEVSARASPLCGGPYPSCGGNRHPRPRPAKSRAPKTRKHSI